MHFDGIKEKSKFDGIIKWYLSMILNSISVN